MRPEIIKVGSQDTYAVDLIIGKERFRIRYFAGHRVDPLKDAQKFAAKIGAAIKKQSGRRFG